MYCFKTELLTDISYIKVESLAAKISGPANDAMLSSGRYKAASTVHYIEGDPFCWRGHSLVACRPKSRIFSSVTHLTLCALQNARFLLQKGTCNPISSPHAEDDSTNVENELKR